MSQISRPSQFHGLDANFMGLTRAYNTAKAVNGGIDLGVSNQTAQGPGTAYSGNLNGQWVNVTAPGANVEFAVPHNLNRVPSYYFWNSDRACNLYQLPNTGTAWTTTNVYLKCSVASAVLRIFLG